MFYYFNKKYFSLELSTKNSVITIHSFLHEFCICSITALTFHIINPTNFRINHEQTNYRIPSFDEKCRGCDP